MSMTNQEAFNRVVVHLNVQRDHAMNKEDYCLYREPITRKKCAIGCLIPDEMYSREMEGVSIENLLITYEGLPFEEVDRELLSDLQGTHDSLPVGRWKANLRTIARRYNLDAGILKIWH